MIFELEQAGGNRDAEKIKRDLDAIPGVLSVSVSRDCGRVAVDYDTTGPRPDELRDALASCGCGIASERREDHTM